jgi:hypothetical protein
MEVKKISLAEIIILLRLIIAIIYSFYLNMKDVALAALVIIRSYLAKDIEINNNNNNNGSNGDDDV